MRQASRRRRARAPIFSGPALTADPSPLDPDTYYEAEGLAITTSVYEGLLRYENDSPKIIGALAKSWDVTDGSRTFTFKLLDGVKFSDGTPFDSAAAKASFQRRIDLKGGPSYMLADVQSMSTPDPSTFVVQSAQAVAGLPGLPRVAVRPAHDEPDRRQEAHRGERSRVEVVRVALRRDRAVSAQHRQAGLALPADGQPALPRLEAALQDRELQRRPEHGDPAAASAGRAAGSRPPATPLSRSRLPEEGGESPGPARSRPCSRRASGSTRSRRSSVPPTCERRCGRTSTTRRSRRSSTGTSGRRRRTSIPPACCRKARHPTSRSTIPSQLAPALAPYKGRKVTVGYYTSLSQNRELASRLQTQLESLGLKATLREYPPSILFNLPAEPNQRPDILATGVQPRFGCAGHVRADLLVQGRARQPARLHGP